MTEKEKVDKIYEEVHKLVKDCEEVAYYKLRYQLARETQAFCEMIMK